MKINHRITLNSDDPRVTDLERVGAQIDRKNPTIWVFNVTEDDPAWHEIKRVASDLFQPWCISTIYTEEEMAAADYLELVPLGHHGYPQPEKDGGYVQCTYDTADHCSTCGIGGQQNGPFRLRKEPGSKHSEFLQLNWVFDEYFVRDAARQGLETAGITGLEFTPSVIHKSDKAIANLHQLKIDHILPPALDARSLQPVTCKLNNEEDKTGGIKSVIDPTTLPRCGRVKYHMHRRGPFRLDHAAFKGAPDVVKTHEWFGSGGSAFRLILVSQKLRRLVLDNRWRGVSLEPVQLVSAD